MRRGPGGSGHGQQYSGSNFAIGMAAGSAVIYKSADERGVPSYGDRN